MSFIDTIRPTAAFGAVREMYQRQQDHWGYVPNYAKVFSHRPEALARWGRLLAELRRPADDRRFELVTFAAACTLQHSACALAHGRALADIIGRDEVMAIAANREADVLPAADVACVRFARRIAIDASAVEQADIDALHGHGLSDAEIFDIAAIAAGRCFFTKLLDALGCQPDAEFRKLDDEFRQALTLGRPIDRNPTEHLAVTDAA